MEWKELLTTERLAEEEKEPNEFDNYYISPFERDYEKIVSSAAFRRLQDKTQVFSLSRSDFVRTRLTHSIEVSTIAKQLGIMCFNNKSEYLHLPIDPDETEDDELRKTRIQDVEAVLSCAGLLHDLGNPPFGHVGEEIIREWFKNNLKKIYIKNGDSEKPVFDVLKQEHIQDLENFEGNAQAFRILAKARYGSEINLPYSIMSALVKYPTACDEMDETAIIRHKLGYYQAEKNTFMRIAQNVGTINGEGRVIRHPLAYLLEAADDIAYMTADLEDAVKSGMVSVNELLKFFQDNYEEEGRNKGESNIHIIYTKNAIEKLEYYNQQEEDAAKVINHWGTYLRRWLMYVACWRFSKSYENIIQGTYEYDLFYKTNHSLTVVLLKQAMKKFVYNSRKIIEPEVAAQNILSFLLDRFVPAIVRMDSAEMTPQEKKLILLVSPNYIDDYYKAKNKDNITDEVELLYRRILISTDFISGMTDGYAKTLYKKMSGTV